MTVAPRADSFGFPAPLKPINQYHAAGLERIIKLLPHPLANGHHAKLCPYLFFIAPLVFHQGADNVPEVDQVRRFEVLVLKLGEFVLSQIRVKLAGFNPSQLLPNQEPRIDAEINEEFFHRWSVRMFLVLSPVPPAKGQLNALFATEVAAMRAIPVNFPTVRRK